ncbi:MAG TPA: endo alpha-1,4 polygalactosaminidase, partial [Microbacterium sp.]|nr:endo alpha-1,4 polygalactosaminidase [Microbacterium sp.]
MRVNRLMAVGGAVAMLAVLAACASGAGDGAAPERTTAVDLPPTTGVFDYQLGGDFDEVDAGDGFVAIDVVVRDATAKPLTGAYSICYVNGFQTQPGDADDWRDQPSLLLHDETGEAVADPEWPDEYVLDPSTAAQRDGILQVIGPIIDGCSVSGFDAVEIDNLDTWTRF